MTTRRPDAPLSRRTLLSGLGAAGIAGALGGAGTGAFFADGARFPENALRAGALDLKMQCEGDTCKPTGDGLVAISLSDVRPGDAGTETVRLAVHGNPGWLWLAASCPTSPLAEAIEVRIALDRACDGAAEFVLSGTLEEVLLELRRGVRPFEECLDPTEAACLIVEWAFPLRPDVERYAGTVAGFDLQFHLEQCRHNDGHANPFANPECAVTDDRRGISFIEVWGCANDPPACDCTLLGKLELSDAYVAACDDLVTDGIGENRIVPGRYDLPLDDDCEDSGYDLIVTSTTESDSETTAIAFELVDDTGEPGPDLCRVVIKGGPTTITYDEADLVPRSNATPGELGAPTAVTHQ